MKCSRALAIGALAYCVLLSSRPAVAQPGHEQSTTIKTQKDDNDAPVDFAQIHNPVLWHDPGPIAALDLFYGQGGKNSQPLAPFTFESEDLHGTNPKFNVRDSQGTGWRVKLGNEAQPEVAASRLLWAVGYFVEDDYLLPSADIQNLRIKRASPKGGHIENARFSRKPEGQKKIGIWSWKDNPFKGTREFNGLRVMMALMNNWDLKDENNAVFKAKDSGNDVFLTSDIGATFGTNGVSWSKDRSKGDADTFEKSKFIKHKSATSIDFATPAAPDLVMTPKIKRYEMRRGLEWIGKDIPIADARWIGSLLKQLSHQQLLDAFRAAHFSPQEVDTYARVVESRIEQLAAL
ncbi:MAG TPA: hypothetical protein VKR52_18465 [Terracidiphilus sp.]|nr:hypothetical protein [Terracidiphilus sp.]